MLNARYTLVELDSKILEWVSELLKKMDIEPIIAYNVDAYDYIINNKIQYDLICTDVFIDRTVPEQFLTIDFFNSIKKTLKKNGIWIMNYMAPFSIDPIFLKMNIAKVFPNYQYIQNRENFIFIVET